MEEDYIKVFSGTFIIVQLLRDRLESVGINAVVKEESGLGNHSGFSSVNSGFQEVYVSKQELDQAVPIVEEVKSEMQA